MGLLGYTVLLFEFLGLAIYISVLTNGQMAAVAAGAVLFTLSDLILLRGKTHQWRFPVQHELIWLLYSWGQMLIAFSIASTVGL